MIVFYTKYNVIDSFSVQSLLSFAFDCVNGMRNVPESFKNCSYNGDESREWKETGMLQYPIPILGLCGVLMFSKGFIMYVNGKKEDN